MLVSKQNHDPSGPTKPTDAVDSVSSPVLPIDLKTPDKWVARDERLIRLTGAHPFNCEPPLSLLFHEGFITPPQLHFVRNHGQVAQISNTEAANWTISIEGMVEKPITISLKDLQADYDAISLPVTLTCAGNRRKEQNTVRKTKGFSWGSAGTSTSFWTGALLCDVLRETKPQKGARYVVFEGAEDLPNGKYATGVLLSWALDFDRGIILAWKQNGMALMPDHGRPLRMVIPGVIGGRSVKWLKRIIVQNSPPDGWYHKYDNRVIPTSISPEVSALSDEWWEDERYTIYNLNLQSVIVIPEHNSTLAKSTRTETFSLRGFAYNGGGIQVSRVEVSLDSAKSWIQAKIRYPEEELRNMNARGDVKEIYGGKLDLADRYLSFCWCFWELELPTKSLICAKDIVVRAMDLNMVSQPRDMYWSVLGMLGNWWFRVAIIDEVDKVRFVHPTNLKASDGWMDMMKERGQDPSKWFAGAIDTCDDEVVASSPKEGIKIVQDDKLGIKISKAELAKNENWFVIHGQVYDGTGYLKDHPGGPESIKMVSGEDATDDFMAIHSENARRLLSHFHIGQLEESLTDLENNNEKKDDPIDAKFLNPKKWKTTTLVKRTDLSHDVRQLDFALETPDQTSGLLVGTHVFVRTRDKANELVMRAFTPISCHRTQGILSLLVKVYFPGKQAPGGRMGMLLEKLKVGDQVEIKGPVGSFRYLGKGKCLHKGHDVSAKKFYMVSGGSGVTPCYQIIKELVSDENDVTQCHLLFGNREYTDIMCNEELEGFKDKAKGRVTINYWLSRPPKGERVAGNVDYKVGRINHNVLDEYLMDIAINDCILMVCGPDGMVESVKSWAARNQVPESRLVVF